jgi:hypothetical protein
LAQARCGIFFSWQLGHSDSECFDKASCARRVEVRFCECRRFGLGMENSSMSLALFGPQPDFDRYIANIVFAVLLPRFIPVWDLN